MGRDSANAHVDAIGLHLQCSLQPCMNPILIFFGSPSGGIDLDPVINWKSSPIVKPTFSPEKQFKRRQI